MEGRRERLKRSRRVRVRWRQAVKGVEIRNVVHITKPLHRGGRRRGQRKGDEEGDGKGI